MVISVFGNQDLKEDSLPIKILPELQKRFPQIQFKIEDPNELGLPDTDDWWIIDTVEGIGETTLLSVGDIKDLNMRLSLHDFDLGSHLLWLKKIKNNLQIKIIGVPANMDKKTAIMQVVKLLEIT